MAGIITEAIDRYPDRQHHLEAIFRRVERVVSAVLIPGQQINLPDWQALGSPYFIFIGNSRLRPTKIDLRNADYDPIGGIVSYPGKSCIIDPFKLNPDQPITKPQGDILVRLGLGRAKGTKRQDYFYLVELSSLNQSGFAVYYAPVKRNRLHARIVHYCHLTSDPCQYRQLSIPLRARINLIGALHKLARNYH